jgi:hypothetical protein
MSLNNEPHPEVVNGERWLMLLDYQEEDTGVTIEHAQFTVDEGVFVYLAYVGIEYVLHPRVVYQFRFFIHTP